MNKRVIKPKCIICTKELKKAIVIPSRINNRSFEMLVNLSLPICKECKKKEADKLNNKEVKMENNDIMTKCVMCGKEFPAVVYGVSKSNYGVGVPESMMDHQNGDLEFYEKNTCDDCVLKLKNMGD